MDEKKSYLLKYHSTIWLGVLQELEKNRYDLSNMKRILCGGAAAPKSVIAAFEQKYNVPFVHA
ncbi:hypothetical protein [Bacillus cereus group sp. BfR-BA-01380]|uniref:hypothetical protein n=1 Tax=Bacillus cereus group sp. BfR-BA-01380 TaxID=2920324 RepID=UPI001F5603C0|nr:hypothetical protein [Bacillus cereus group sp. BfR-BA-01380]